MSLSNYYWLLFHKDRLLLEKGASGTVAFPFAPTCPLNPLTPPRRVGEFQGHPCFAAETPPPPDGSPYTMVGLRSAYSCLDEKSHALAGRAYQMLYWDAHSRYCPRCGSPTLPDDDPAVRCSACGELRFPHMYLAVLVLVTRDDSILLVHPRNFIKPYYSCIAGFVEPGETLEQCVAREVLEETNIQVQDIQYAKCQPWPFPNTLMVGFTAAYSSGSLALQESELDAGAFFSRDALPGLSPSFSLSRWLIDDWLARR